MKISILFKNIFKHSPIQLCIFILILIFSGLIEALGLIFLAPIFDNILGNGSENSSALTTRIYLILNNLNIETNLNILFVIFVSSTILTAISSTVCIYFSEKIKYSFGYNLMKSTLKNLFNIKWVFFTKAKQGSLLNTINRELTVIINTLSIIARIFSNFIQFIIIGFIPFAISWKLVLIMVFTLIIISLPLIVLTKYARKVGEKDTFAHKDFLNSLQETFSGFKLIIGNSLQKVSKTNLLAKYLNLIRIAIIRAVLFTGISNVILPITSVGFVVLYFASTEVLDIKIVEITVIAAAFVRMASKFGQIIREKASLEAALASLMELNLINKSNKKLLIRNGNKELLNYNEKIEFKNVHYYYDKSNLVLKNLTLSFENKKITGITGESGSGKSTIIDLIMGFDFPSEGQIKISNINIKDLNINQYRKKIGYVSQDAVLFNTSILKNILWTNPNAKKIDVENLIKSSKAFDFIFKLPNKLNTLVGDRGISLSGGQIQRISLLRALIKNPEVLVLDEGTSALDNKNEKHIIALLNKLKKTKLIILVAHNLTTLKHVDKLFVINNGKVFNQRNINQIKKNNKF